MFEMYSSILSTQLVPPTTNHGIRESASMLSPTIAHKVPQSDRRIVSMIVAES